MKRKNVIIISIAGITLVLLCLLGFTYGYFMTVINGNTSAKSIDVITSIKGLEIADLTLEDISATIEPGYENIKLFTVKNTGNTKTSYNIYLTDVVNTFERTEDVEFTLYRKDGNATIDTSDLSDCTIISSGSLPTTNSYIATNEIINSNGDYYTYALEVNYKNLTDINQDVDQGKTFSYKVIIDSEIINPFTKNTLGYTIIESAKKGGENRTKYGYEKTTFTSISGVNERVLNTAPDDYGTSYYFRGNILDNYVTFAGLTWRIVRINGDGSIRLILDDAAKKDGVAIKSKFNSNTGDNAYIGYMYGTPGSTTYETTHENINDSTIKIAVDQWYKDNLETNYANYLSDTLFCNDKTLASNGIGGVTTQIGYGTNETYYASAERLEFSTGTTGTTISKPTFKCAENATNTYSRFTVDVTTLPNGNQTNGNLTYPIGLLTADEAAYAGAYKNNQENKTYYLKNFSSSTTSYWWLLTPNLFKSSYPYGYMFYYSTGLFKSFYFAYDASSFRPVINIKSNLLVSGGDGTKASPYTVKLS